MFGSKDKNQDEMNSDQSTQRIALIIELLEQVQSSARRAAEMLRDGNMDDAQLVTSLEQLRASSEASDTEQVIEGVFNGERMIGPDGTDYNVPANYASKSKLVEGDMLKLSITRNGSFIYKQIGPIARQQLVAKLARNESTYDWYAVQDGQRWRLLTAAVTYYHGQPGDEVVILTPQSTPSAWAAVENIIKR